MKRDIKNIIMLELRLKDLEKELKEFDKIRNKKFNLIRILVIDEIMFIKDLIKEST